MERRFAARMEEALEGALGDPRVFRERQPPRERFRQPLVACLHEPEHKAQAQSYVTGLRSDLQRKPVDAVASWHDPERVPVQKFIGCSPWDHQPGLQELTRQVGAARGAAGGVIVFAPSAPPTKGSASGGVQRQWCGRLGQSDNGQGGGYLGYVSRREQALVDARLYWPQSWASAKKRRNKAGVPKAVRFQTRQELALAMLDEQGALRPQSWVAGDAALGRSTYCRRALQGRNERYLLRVPRNTLMLSRAPARKRPCRSLPASSLRSLASSQACRGPRAQPACRTTRCARGGAGLILRSWRSAPPGS